MSPPNSLARLLARRAQALNRHFTAALEGSDLAVHQARVAARRLREAVPPLIEGLKHARGRYVCRKLRVVTRTLGTIRELDVALHLVDDLHERRAQKIARLLSDGPRNSAYYEHATLARAIRCAFTILLVAAPVLGQAPPPQ